MCSQTGSRDCLGWWRKVANPTPNNQKESNYLYPVKNFNVSHKLSDPVCEKKHDSHGLAKKPKKSWPSVRRTIVTPTRWFLMLEISEILEMFVDSAYLSNLSLETIPDENLYYFGRAVLGASEINHYRTQPKKPQYYAFGCHGPGRRFRNSVPWLSCKICVPLGLQILSLSKTARNATVRSNGSPETILHSGKIIWNRAQANRTLIIRNKPRVTCDNWDHSSAIEASRDLAFSDPSEAFDSVFLDYRQWLRGQVWLNIFRQRFFMASEKFLIQTNSVAVCLWYSKCFFTFLRRFRRHWVANFP
jgi:hypothetical protein